MPDLRPGGCIERTHLIRSGDVHDAVSNQWNCLQSEVPHVFTKIRRVRKELGPERNRKCPLEAELIYVGGVDLLQIAISIPVQRSVVREPVAWFRIQNARKGNPAFVGGLRCRLRSDLCHLAFLFFAVTGREQC